MVPPLQTSTSMSVNNPNPSTSNSVPVHRLLSKVNSFKRNWGAEDGDEGLDSGKNVALDVDVNGKRSIGGVGTSPRGKEGKKRRLGREDSDKSLEGGWEDSPPRRSTSTNPRLAALPSESIIITINPSLRLSNAPISAPKPPTIEDAVARRRAAVMAALGESNSGAGRSASGSTLLSAVGGQGRPGAGVGSGDTYTAIARSSVAGPSRSNGMTSMPWAADGLKTRQRIPLPASAPTASTISGANANRSLNVKQKIVLSGEQQKVLAMVVNEGKSLFFTGSAGTGKSVLLREIISGLRKKFSAYPDAVAITASTGIAACNIGGVTLHSFSGVGLALLEPEKLVAQVRKNKKALSRWLRTKVLIIDEVSMVEGQFFDKLAKIGSLLRKSSKPFGGIQVIVTGDFFQLPPVTKSGVIPVFAFEAAIWNETVATSVNLTKVFRQKDQTFVNMLNEMRFGKMTQDSIQKFKSLSRPLPMDDGIDPTELFPRREEVDRANSSRITCLKGEAWTYNSADGPATNIDSRDKILSMMMAPQSIQLKLNAQVMLIKNIDETLVNGSMGRVVGFVQKHQYIEDSAGRWTGAEPKDDGLISEDEEGFSKAKQKKQVLQSSSKPLPVVSFRIPGGGTRDMLVDVDTFKSELPNGEIAAQRVQLPLILSWAMSIHKSQGQTLDKVKVDLGRVFEKGQAYVALSRATSLQGLQVTGFQEAKVMAHPKVVNWTSKLVTLE